MDKWRSAAVACITAVYVTLGVAGNLLGVAFIEGIAVVILMASAAVLVVGEATVSVRRAEETQQRNHDT